MRLHPDLRWPVAGLAITTSSDLRCILFPPSLKYSRNEDNRSRWPRDFPPRLPSYPRLKRHLWHDSLSMPAPCIRNTRTFFSPGLLVPPLFRCHFLLSVLYRIHYSVRFPLHRNIFIIIIIFRNSTRRKKKKSIIWLASLLMCIMKQVAL